MRLSLAMYLLKGVMPFHACPTGCEDHGIGLRKGMTQEGHLFETIPDYCVDRQAHIVQLLYEIVLMGKACDVGLVPESKLLSQAQFVRLHGSHTKIELVGHLSQFEAPCHET